MRISIVEFKSNKVLDQSEITWQELKELLTKHETRYKNKTDVPMFSPAEFRPGQARSNQAVSAIHFGVIDCDSITTAQLDKIKAKLALTSYVCYTSWSHTKELEMQGQYRVRFVFPFSRPVGEKLWGKAWAKLNVFFEGLIDQSCKDLQRGYFFPASPNADGFWAKTNVGLDFDVDKLLMTSDSELKSGKVTADDLKKLADALSRKKAANAKQISEAINLGLAGKPIAFVGERDNALFVMAQEIAKEFPDCDPHQVSSLFTKSIQEMHQDSKGNNSSDWFVDKLVRAKESVETKRKERQELVEEEMRSRIKLAYGGDNPRDYPYTPEELSQFAADARCSLEQFNHRWILQHMGDYRIFFNGRYWGPFGEKAALTFAYTNLAPAVSAGVRTEREGAKGGPINKTITELIQEYGTTVNNSKASLVVQSSYYDDQEKTLVEATCPLRVTEAKYDPLVAEYLRLLGGENEERLLDFISVVTQVENPCAALYLYSPPGYGKGTLVKGLARLFTKDGPTPLPQALTKFNAAIAKCPLVFADETMPPAFKKAGNSGEWREFIQCERRPIENKYVQNIPLEGCIRLIMAANNKDMLGGLEELSRYDIEAIIERVCFIDCANPEVRKFLQGLPVGTVKTFETEDRMAKHALWLRDNHAIKEKSRFFISARNTSFHRSMIVGQGLPSTISHWLVSYLQQPNLIDMNASNSGHFRIKEGELYITTKGLNDNWDTYDTHCDAPTPTKIAKALTRITHGETSQKGRFQDKVFNYWQIDKESLIAWAEENAYSSREEIEKALSKDTQMRSSDFQEPRFLKEIMGKGAVA